MEPAEAPLGLRSKVHKSLVDDDRLLGVPYTQALGNGLLWIILAATFQYYRLLLVMVLLHVGMWLVTRTDIDRIAILSRYLLYRLFYGRSAGMADEFGDELPWSVLVDVPQGVMETDEHGLFCTYAIIPYDLGSLAEAERGTLMLRLNQAFKRLDERWVVWAHLKSVPTTTYPQAPWSHPGAALLDDEHRQQLTAAPGRWQRLIYLTLYRRPTSTSASLLRTLFFQEETVTQRDDALADFEAEVERTIGVLGLACKETHRLSGKSLLQYLRRFVALDDDDHPIEVPDVPTDLAYYLSADCGFWPGTRPMIGTQTRRQVLRTLSLSKDIPDELWTAMMEALYREPFAFDVGIRWMPMPRAEAERLTGKKEINWLSKQKGWLAGLHERLTGQPSEAKNTHMKKQALDADAARDEMLSEESNLGHLSMTLLVRSPTFDPMDGVASSPDADEALLDADAALADLDHALDGTSGAGPVVSKAEAYRLANEQIRRLRTIVQTIGCVCIDEDLNATDAYFSMIPGEITKNVRKHTLTSLNFTHLGFWHLPWAGVPWNDHLNGPALCQAIAVGCMPFSFDPYAGDLGDTLTIGPKGSGKSTLSAWMDYVQWLKYANSLGPAQVIAFDAGGSWRAVTLFLHGQYLDLGAGAVPIQILRDVDDEHEWPWIHDWLLRRLAEKQILLTADVEKILAGALRRLRENRSLPRRMTTLQALLSDHLRHVDMSSNAKIDANGMSRRDARLDALVKLIEDIKGALKIWTAGGKYGHLVDAPEDRMHWSAITTFELRRLLELPEAYEGVLELVRHRVNQRIDGRPTRLPYGEAHEYFHSALHVEHLRRDIAHWRRDNASANFSTQAKEQLEGNPVTAFLLGSCHTRLFTPNAKALTEEVRQGYLDLELHSEEIRENIVLAEPKAQVYVVHDAGRRLMTLRLAPMAQLVCGGNSREAHALMDDILDHDGAEAFPWRYLEVHGFHEEAKALAQTLAHRRDAAHRDALLGTLASTR